MSVRTLNWFESESDTKIIKSNNWNLNVAKCVTTGSGEPIFNVIWQSQAVAPIIRIQWKEEYALGWTADVPSEGVRVSIAGRWQKCDKGQSYSINELGYWEPSSNPVGPPGWLKVGKIDYAYPGVAGIHIIVGVKNPRTGEFEPVFVDTATLPRNSTTQYQPQETVSWWLEGLNNSGQVYSGSKSMSTIKDFTTPSNIMTQQYEWSTSYMFTDARWIISAGSPPQAMIMPPPSAHLTALDFVNKPPFELQLDHANWLITFTAPIAAAALAMIVKELSKRLTANFKQLQVNILGNDGTRIRLVYQAGNDAAPGTVAFLSTLMGVESLVNIIERSMTEMKSENMIPSDAQWAISSSANALSLDTGADPEPTPPSSGPPTTT